MIALLTTIRAAGATIEVVDADLRLRVPKGLLAPEDRNLLAEHKQQILRLLAAEAAWDSSEPVEGLDPCGACESLEQWQDVAGRWHCSHCEVEGLRRSDQVAARARWLRAKVSGGRHIPHSILAKRQRGI